MWILNKFVKLRKTDLLSEALTSTYLHMKWTSIRKFYYFHILCFLVYLLSLTTLIIWSSWRKDYDEENGNSNMTRTLNASDDPEFVMDIDNFYSQHQELWIFLYALTWGATFLISIGEFVQGIDNPKEYVQSMENVYEMVAIVSSWVYLLLIWFSDVQLGLTYGAEQAFAAIAIFFAWIKMTFMIGSLPAVGIYASMSILVVKHLFQFFAVFLTTLIAFAFTLHILLPKHPVFKNPFTSFLKVLVMLIGEFDFNDTFTVENVNIYGVPASQGLTQFFFVLLLFLVSIVIANLIIGLSVSNIEELLKESEIYKMEKMVQQISAAEKFFNHNLLSSLVPKRFRDSFEGKTKLFARLKRKGLPCSKVCILPNKSSKTAKFGKMKFFKIFTFNELEGTKGNSISMDLPESILEKTLQCLKAKTELEKELDKMLEEFEDNSISNRHVDGVSFQNSEIYRSRKNPKGSFKWEQVLNQNHKNKWKQAGNRLLDKIIYESDGSVSSDSRYLPQFNLKICLPLTIFSFSSSEESTEKMPFIYDNEKFQKN